MRDREASGIIGFKGQGKTPFLVKLLNECYDMRTARILYTCPSHPFALQDIPVITNLDTLGKRKWRGMFLYIIKERGSKMIAKINELSQDGVFAGGAIVYDDCKQYIQHNAPEEMQGAMISHKNYGYDLFAVTQSLIDYPAFLRRNTSSLTLFKTADNFKNENDFLSFRYPNASAVYKAWMDVKAMPEQKGKIIQPYLTIKTGV